MMLPSYSQTNSNNKPKDTMVLVPISSLKKALIVLEEKNYCNNQLEIARDTIKTQSQLITNLDTIIKNQSLVVVLLKDNVKKYEKVIENKDTEIKVYQDLYKKEKKTKKLVIGGGSVLLLLSIIFL